MTVTTHFHARSEARWSLVRPAVPGSPCGAPWSPVEPGGARWSPGKRRSAGHGGIRNGGPHIFSRTAAAERHSRRSTASGTFSETITHDMSANLFGNHGGRACKATHVPSDSEGLGLAVGLVMYFTWRTDNSHPQFYAMIAEDVARERLSRLSFGRNGMDGSNAGGRTNERCTCSLFALTRGRQDTFCRNFAVWGPSPTTVMTATTVLAVTSVTTVTAVTTVTTVTQWPERASGWSPVEPGWPGGARFALRSPVEPGGARWSPVEPGGARRSPARSPASLSVTYPVPCGP